MTEYFTAELLAGFGTLLVLEIVLGIDNLIFVAALADRLPEAQRSSTRRIGLLLAVGTRLALLGALSWLTGLTRPVFEVFGHAFSWRDMILLGGGLFLIYNATVEIHGQVEGGHHELAASAAGRASVAGVLVQIAALDIVFSLDSVLTAIGMVNQLEVMAAAIVLSSVVMIAASGPVGEFVGRHPTVKMLALSFLLMVGLMLVADGFSVHVPKGYLYAAIGFSMLVETLNLLSRGRVRRRRGMAPGETDV